MEKRRRLPWIFGIMTVFMLVSNSSCTNKEEKLYGKVLAKGKQERELIERVQNATFSQLNANITLKEAVTANRYSKNIVWDIEPLEKLGTYLVSFQYDIYPLQSALSMDFFNEAIARRIYFIDDFYERTQKDMDDQHAYTESDVMSPIGFDNIFTRFIQGEMITPHSPGIVDEMQSLLDAYTEYRKDYEEARVFIPIDRLPEMLPKTFFTPTAATFKGDCYIELKSEEVKFVQFTLLFDFNLPYMDNKEYKGVGITINDGIQATGLNYFEIIPTILGLEFVYDNLPIGILYPYATRPREKAE
jgi:hypothetical protein